MVGASFNAILEQIAYHKEIEWIHVRNEEAGAFGAGAQAHLTGELSVCAGKCKNNPKRSAFAASLQSGLFFTGATQVGGKNEVR